MQGSKSYYKTYESAHINNIWFVSKAARQAVEKLGAPYRRRRRGRPLRLEPKQAAILLITQAAQHRTFRASEDFNLRSYMLTLAALKCRNFFVWYL